MKHILEEIINGQEVAIEEIFKLINCYNITSLNIQDANNTVLEMQINHFEAYKDVFEFSQEHTDKNSYVVKQSDILSVNVSCPFIISSNICFMLFSFTYFHFLLLYFCFSKHSIYHTKPLVNTFFIFLNFRFTFIELYVIIIIYQKMKGYKNMSLSYEPLWQMLNNMNITKMEFAKMIGMSNATLAKLSKNEPITLTTVDKICNQFNCPIENVVKHIQEFQNHESIFTIGAIILTNNPVNVEAGNYRLRKCLCVILKVIPSTDRNDSEKIIYKVASIYKTSPNHNKDFSNIYFENVDIDNKPTSGYISLKNIFELPSEKFEKKVGIMPPKYMQKITE